MNRGLTPAEHHAMDLTAELWNHLVQNVVADGPTRNMDCAELAAKIHAIQHTIMGQAAARAHSKLYRLLGGELLE